MHLVRYPDSITIDLAQTAQADFLDFCRAHDRPAPIVMIVERVFPMPSVEVRSFWRAAASEEPGFDAIALILGGVVGLMAAAATHLGEQLVEVLGVRFRSFKQPADAARWLCGTADCGVDELELTEVIEELRAIDLIEP